MYLSIASEVMLYIDTVHQKMFRQLRILKTVQLDGQRKFCSNSISARGKVIDPRKKSANAMADMSITDVELWPCGDNLIPAMRFER